jgi:hypothetical protein
LLVAAYRSGPSWIGESNWALGGLTVVALVAVAGMAMCLGSVVGYRIAF